MQEYVIFSLNFYMLQGAINVSFPHSLSFSFPPSLAPSVRSLLPGQTVSQSVPLRTPHHEAVIPGDLLHSQHQEKPSCSPTAVARSPVDTGPLTPTKYHPFCQGRLLASLLPRRHHSLRHPRRSTAHRATKRLIASLSAPLKNITD